MKKYKINSFRMKVTPEQSAIVQKIMFQNGYCWRCGNHDILLVNHTCLIFDENEDGGRISCFVSMNIYKYLPIITYDWFINKYDIKSQRKRKIKNLQKLYEI